MPYTSRLMQKASKSVKADTLSIIDGSMSEKIIDVVYAPYLLIYRTDRPLIDMHF
mgnify:FL=1